MIDCYIVIFNIMRADISNNLIEIKKHYKKRVSIDSFLNRTSINQEFREWIDDSFKGNEEIWTLPDLTVSYRLENFCRSIKKKIY